MKQQLKNQPLNDDGDPDSRMETERMGAIGGERKKASKGKGLRGSSKSGGKLSYKLLYKLSYKLSCKGKGLQQKRRSVFRKQFPAQGACYNTEYSFHNRESVSNEAC